MKEQLTYRVNDKGLPPPEQSRIIRDYHKKHIDKRITMTLDDSMKRTTKQNSWLHKIVNMITEFERETAKDSGDVLYYQISDERVKLNIKEKYLGWEEIDGQKRLRHTSNLNTLQMNELWEALQIEYAPLGLYLPDPNEKTDDKDNL